MCFAKCLLVSALSLSAGLVSAAARADGVSEAVSVSRLEADIAPAESIALTGTDAALMLLAGVGLVAIQLRRRQRSLSRGRLGDLDFAGPTHEEHSTAAQAFASVRSLGAKTGEAA